MQPAPERSAQSLAEACAARMWAQDRASRALGMEVLWVAPGRARLRMTVTPEMTNGHGSAHGGYLFTLADSAFAFACNTYDARTVGQGCSITYIAPGRLGDVLIAEAREVARQGRSGLYDVRISRAGDDMTLAEFRGQSRTIRGTLLPEA
ncbi:hydroxyphenylacetyl-CoA thioesterase PaaI [Pseudooceanicola sp. CBS1P-1]|uniref:Hydroxyphenylacetyl-CoA thioesterase PaaI n=1 Tax=Pseudooceanicola albus TaxID=2692189 RepID=A0A6L7G5R3_9RHOB|nr:MULTISPECIES: hydroxyphenylacetyl-CoA thioesterase PaaI [Pseudooceanicola]MBT9385405.1 hydroxyphenylacetyl-CoA thioesterase PaaI [Pseudooceanicola endophyticus]MXN18736.1 hydroxyphenylacetyl-CoA thioesterase PaaI [Pseudooceanicola albus]